MLDKKYYICQRLKQHPEKTPVGTRVGTFYSNVSYLSLLQQI